MSTTKTAGTSDLDVRAVSTATRSGQGDAELRPCVPGAVGPCLTPRPVVVGRVDRKRSSARSACRACRHSSRFSHHPLTASVKRGEAKARRSALPGDVAGFSPLLWHHVRHHATHFLDSRTFHILESRGLGPRRDRDLDKLEGRGHSHRRRQKLRRRFQEHLEWQGVGMDDKPRCRPK